MFRSFTCSRQPRRLLLIAWCALLLLTLSSIAWAPSQPAPLRVVIVGGGPDPDNNQVAIESNVRYVGRLLPEATWRYTLFADGDTDRATVLFEDDDQGLRPGERVLGLLLDGVNGGTRTRRMFRKPRLETRLDGASRLTDVRRIFGELRDEEQGEPLPVLLYFTGHGSPDDRSRRENNAYDLWGGSERLSVHELARQIARLPDSAPVTVVMVQCFSGAFANLIFEDGDRDRGLINRDIAGFFATVKERPAAGCTPAINEAEYRDFTSYFFSALTGRDRVGRTVTGADYNHDGRVGMDEAFCYALAHDDSIDVPVCTSDAFLREFVRISDKQVFETPFDRIRAWARPAQRAALDLLSRRLGMRGQDRASVAYDSEARGDDLSHDDASIASATQTFERERQLGRTTLFARWPALRSASRLSDRNRAEAVRALDDETRAGRWDALLRAEQAVDRSEDAKYRAQLDEALRLRFVRLAKSVVLAHRLQEDGSAQLRERFAHLVEAEGRTPIPPVASQAMTSVAPGVQRGEDAVTSR
jgi:hypothetical protein